MRTHYKNRNDEMAQLVKMLWIKCSVPSEVLLENINTTSNAIDDVVSNIGYQCCFDLESRYTKCFGNNGRVVRLSMEELEHFLRGNVTQPTTWKAALKHCDKSLEGAEKAQRSAIRFEKICMVQKKIGFEPKNDYGNQ